ncbi:hypothetical protein Ciccas_010333 [Cichlidogyrus casuarinus]|uniref:Uncharacterized protein n=1 Tax=Cichlidogyrus casuarinus TaxID=1844966 RepID=A0ABD2PW16_9PLAT
MATVESKEHQGGIAFNVGETGEAHVPEHLTEKCHHKDLTPEDIAKEMNDVEMRRQNIEQEKVHKAHEHLEHVQQVHDSRPKDEAEAV